MLTTRTLHRGLKPTMLSSKKLLMGKTQQASSCKLVFSQLRKELLWLHCVVFSLSLLLYPAPPTPVFLINKSVIKTEQIGKQKDLRLHQCRQEFQNKTCAHLLHRTCARGGTHLPCICSCQVISDIIWCT